MAEPLRVVLAEDNYLVREGTRRLLADSGEVDVVAAVGDARELLDAVDRVGPDAVVTDIRMPPEHRREGIEAALTIRAGRPDTGVVVLSQYSDALYAFELFQHGTAGLAYLLKDRVGDLDERVRAVREVVAGRSVIDAEIVDGLLARQSGRRSSPLSRLTPRELEVLHLMAQGRANPGIMKKLVLSESAVEKHVSSIFAKLDLFQEPETHRRVAAVLAFLRETGDSGP